MYSIPLSLAEFSGSIVTLSHYNEKVNTTWIQLADGIKWTDIYREKMIFADR